jgi:FMN-dependent NADH-azoreductase
VNLFRLDASIRRDGSVSREVADTVQRAWQAEHPSPSGTVRYRDLGLHPLPATAWRDAVAGGFVPAAERSPEQAAALGLASDLAGELRDADAYLFAVPLYNWGVPQHVKAWWDVLWTNPDLRALGERPLAGRPASLVVVRGGGYAPGTPKEGWDHATPWLRRVFGDILGLDLHLTEAELTLADVNPAMAGLRDKAAQLRAEAHVTAERHGPRHRLTGARALPRERRAGLPRETGHPALGAGRTAA